MMPFFHIMLVLFAARGGDTTQVAQCPAGVAIDAQSSLSETYLCALAYEARQTNTDALVVLENGRAVLSWYDQNAPDRIHIMSVTKSIAVLAFGRMLVEGQLEHLDEPVSTFYPEWRQGRKANITLWHLLSHTSGIQDVPNAGLEIEPAPDVVQLALAAELESDPGASFKYNNKAVNLLAGIVHKVTGLPLDEYLGTTVFRDLGITDFHWIRDPAGTPYFMAGLVLGAEDLARLGQLALQHGKWEGEEVVDSAFVSRATQSQHTLYPRHGLLWWLIPNGSGTVGEWDGFYGDGWLGQWLIVLPELNVVAVRLIDRASWTDESHSFPNFRESVISLAEAGVR